MDLLVAYLNDLLLSLALYMVSDFIGSLLYRRYIRSMVKVFRRNH